MMPANYPSNASKSHRLCVIRWLTCLARFKGELMSVCAGASLRISTPRASLYAPPRVHRRTFSPSMAARWGVKDDATGGMLLLKPDILVHMEMAGGHPLVVCLGETNPGRSKPKVDM